MIEPTDKMVEAFRAAWNDKAVQLVATGATSVDGSLATRPAPLVEYTAELTDGPTALVNTIRRTVAEQARPLTVVDYDTAVMRAAEALREALPFGIYKAYTLRDVLPWAKAAVDAASYVPAPAPTTET